MRLQLILSFAITAFAVIPLLAQTSTLRKPSFDIISVKADTAGGPPRRMGTENNRFISENVPLIALIQYAYRSPSGVLLRQHVIGGPSWINTERFDIEAKVEADTRAIPTEQTWLMVQSLLEDRFQLKVHRATREMPVYDLVIAQGGVKMKASEDQTVSDSDDQPDASFDPSARPPHGEATTTRSASGETILWGTAIPISPNAAVRRPHSLPPLGLTTLLAGQVGRPVIDKTNLKVLFDFRLHFVAETLSEGADPSGTSIFTALEEQLGLRFVASKGPVEVLIIDNVLKPTAN